MLTSIKSKILLATVCNFILLDSHKSLIEFGIALPILQMRKQTQKC